VRAAAQRMARLIDDLLSLARLSRAELFTEPVNLTRMARVIGARLRKTDPERKVEFVVQEGLGVEGDATMLTAVLEALIGNAWKFTSQRAEAHIEVGVDETHGQPVYFVRDDGTGFDMAHATKLFAAFQRLHPTSEFPGTGIGLATAHRVIRRHHGRIWAESEVDRGATLFFTIGPEASP
jgi:light-regulated signal transduction histidine kinase (bacteriophytochrome)